MAASWCEFLCFRRNTSRRATVNRRTTAPTTPPAMAPLFDLEWDVVDDTGGEVLEGRDVEDVDKGDGVTAKFGL